MIKIHNSLNTFFENLDKNCSHIVCNSRGEWELDQRWGTFLSLPIRWLFGYENQRIMKIAQGISHGLYEVEKTSSKMESQEADLWIKTIEKVERLISDNGWKNHKANETLLLLKRHKITLLTRQNYHPASPTPPETLAQLIEKGREWKASQKHFSTYELTDKNIALLDRLASFPLLANELIGSPPLQKDFFKWVIQNGHSVDTYALFAGHNEEIIRKCYLSMRCDHQEIPALKVKEKEGTFDLTLPFQIYENNQKIIRDISIFDLEKTIIFGKTVEKKLQEVFNTFAKKNEDVGDLEFLHYADGVSPAIGYWHLHEWKYINDEGEVEQVDLSDPQWYRKIPVAFKLPLKQTQEQFETTFEWEWWFKETKARFMDAPDFTDFKNFFEKKKELSNGLPPNWDHCIQGVEDEFASSPSFPDFLIWLHDCKMRYEENRVDGKNWIEFGAATRTDLASKDFDGAHGMLGFGIPNEQGTEYHFIFLGKYARHFPLGSWEQLKFFCGSHDATFEASDTNFDYLNRQLTFYSVLVHSAQKVQEGLDKIRESAAYAREGKIAFQYQHGCSEFPQTYINGQRKREGLEPLNATRVKCSKVRPSNPVIGSLHWIARHTPFSERIQMSILLCFAPWRSHPSMIDGKEMAVSFYGSDLWNKRESYVPPYIHLRQLRETKKVAEGLRIKRKVSLLPRGCLPAFLKEVREKYLKIKK